MKRLMLVCVCAALAGCAGRSVPPAGSGSTTVKVVGGATLPDPDRADLASAGNRPYLIGPFDKLTIDVFGVEELRQRQLQVDASGRLSFPLVGAVEVGGLTPNEVASLIRDRLKGQFIRNPQVTVNLTDTVSQVITVDGEVQQPGLYPVVGRMTLMRAVATARGLGEYAKQSDVVVFRTVKGQRYAALYNLKAIRRGTYDDPEVFANDVVVVGESNARRLFKDFLSVAPLLTTPLIVALQ